MVLLELPGNYAPYGKPVFRHAEVCMSKEMDRFIRRQEVEEMTGLSCSMIYMLISEGRFPRQIKLGAASRWSMLDIRRWMIDQRGAA